MRQIFLNWVGNKGNRGNKGNKGNRGNSGNRGVHYSIIPTLSPLRKVKK